MSSTTDRLQAEASDFAARLTDLLQRTVDPGALVRVRIDQTGRYPERALVGFQPTRRDPQVATDQLRGMGYDVIPPAAPGPDALA